MPTVIRLRNAKGNASRIGWGKYKDRSIDWILEKDPGYLRFLYFNIKNAHLKGDVCKELGLDPGIAFHKRKEYYKTRYNFETWEGQQADEMET